MTQSRELAFNPFLPEVRDDPYPHYRELREREPVHWNDVLGIWVISRHRDIAVLLRDKRLSANRLSAETKIPIHQRTVPRSMLNSDPPDHTRLRNLVNKAFTPRVVEDLRPRIEALVDELLEDIGRRGAMEVISDYAYPIPITVIAEMLGVPRADRDIFRQWTQKIAVNLDPIRTPEQEATALEAGLRLRGYFSDILRERRKQRGADLISGLIHAQEESDSLSDEEILTMCNLLLIAGHETTVNLIGNGLLALLRHPEQRQRWQQDEGLARTAVEELLRFDSPVQLTGRVALEDLEVDGCTVRKGQAMVLLLGAGNRDPEQFANPEDLDLGREPNPHLSFGAGIHFCLGAPLARLEGQIALDRLVRRFPGMSLTQNEVGWRETVVLRGLKALPVTV